MIDNGVNIACLPIFLTLKLLEDFDDDVGAVSIQYSHERLRKATIVQRSLTSEEPDKTKNSSNKKVDKIIMAS